MHVELYGQRIDLGNDPSNLMVQRWFGHLSPEPETVAWIESLPVGSNFWDVGASVGTHAVRACVRGMQVTAFEPHEPSFNDLCKVRLLNNLAMRCYSMALYDGAGVYGVLGRGRSKYTFIPSIPPSPPAPVLVSTSLDDWAKRNGAGGPDYLKLDVDGNEEKIVLGGQQTLPHIKSALVEVDPVVSPNLVGMMKDMGFSYDQKQVESCMITEGKYKGTANYIFYK